MINKLIENIKKTNAPIVVGLDPMLNYIPQHIQKKAFSELGETLEGAAEAIWQFNKEIVDKTYDLIPAVKPQIAMYEQFGIPGLQAFKKTVDYCKEKGLVVIKPSGVEYDELTPDDMVVVDFDQNVIEGKYRPSSDTATHIELYRAYPSLAGVVHTHSTWAVTFAQAGMSIPALGTTHADYFYGDIPCTRDLTAEEINLDYERNTGLVIIETIGDKDPMEVPGIVVKNHGPFAWGTSPANAVYNAVVLDKVAEMAHHTLTLNPRVKRAPQYLMDKHYFRKHGANAYYGQDN